MDKIRKSLAVSTKVYDAVKDNFRIGMTEKDIKDIILSVSGDCGFGGDIVAGVRSSHIEGDATDYVLSTGDTLILDLQFNADGMWCDTTRTFFVSEPNERVKAAYEAVLRAKRAGEQMLRAGICACDVYKAVCDGFHEYKEYFPHHAGHLFGVETVMQPQFLPHKTDLICVGDTVTLEPGVYFDGEFGIRVEDNYLITKNGFENLFNYSTEIEDLILRGAI